MLDSKSLYLQDEVDDQLIKEFFTCVKESKIVDLRNYFRDLKYKVWTLKEEDDYTSLHRAVFMNSEELVNTIIEELKRRLGFEAKGVLEKFVNEKTAEGMTALHYAAYRGNIKIAKVLFSHGASVDVFSNRGKNVMHMCAEGNQPAMMIYFLHYYSQDIVSIDEFGSTPLHWACYSGAEEAVRFLLGLNADINRQDKEGLTPLHLAVLSNKESIVLNLLQNGADKTIENYKKEIPINLATKKKYANIITLLQDKTYNKLCTLETPIMFIASENFYKYLIFFLMIIPEIVVVLFILPYLSGDIHTMINMSLWGISIFFYIILIGMNPGEMHNTILLKELQPNENPLCHLVDEGENIIAYCPSCYVKKTPNAKHCVICNRCIDGWNHHCFWINKCIGKKNVAVYMLFIIFTLFYSYHCVLFSFFGFTVDPVDTKLFPPQILSLDTNIYLVLCSACIFIFNVIVSYPLLSLLLIQLCKLCKCFDKPTEKKVKPKPKVEVKRTETEMEEKLVEKSNDSDEIIQGAINDNSGRETEIQIVPVKRKIEDEDEQDEQIEDLKDNKENKDDNNNNVNDNDSDEEIKIIPRKKPKEENDVIQENVNGKEEEVKDNVEEEAKDNVVDNKKEEQIPEGDNNNNNVIEEEHKEEEVVEQNYDKQLEEHKEEEEQQQPSEDKPKEEEHEQIKESEPELQPKQEEEKVEDVKLEDEPIEKKNEEEEQQQDKEEEKEENDQPKEDKPVEDKPVEDNKEEEPKDEDDNQHDDQDPEPDAEPPEGEDDF